jgi:hypothetical protein
MSKSHMPAVPPGERSNKGKQTAPERTAKSDDAARGKEHVPDNLKEQDHQGNIAQNTTGRGRAGH